MASGETQRVFIGGALGDGRLGSIRKKVTNQLPVVLLSVINKGSTRTFSTAHLEKRNLSKMSKYWIDRVLSKEKVRARQEGFNLWKAPSIKYTDEEIEQARLVTKNLNGMQYLGDDLREMYPDATFLCLVRHPLVLAEGRLRREQNHSRVVNQLLKVGGKMAEDLDNFENYHLLKFEDMVRSPYEFLSTLYQTLNLSVADVKHIRFQNKATLSKTGSHDLKGIDRSITWYPISDIGAHFQKDVNSNQLANMSVGTKRRLERELQPLIEAFGYN
jgi:hypothetical protein